MPLVSIIVPIYNVEKYLVECLESICHQTLADIEIICIDDGSTDGSVEILRSYAEQDPRIIPVLKKNTGYGNTMNIGISMAMGEYIGVVESDDFASKDMFEVLYNIAKEHNADVVKSNYYIYKSIPNEIKLLEALKNCRYNEIFCPIDQQEIIDVQPSIWSGIYKRDFLRAENIKFLETPGASFQDTSFIFKIWIYAKRVYLIKEAFLYYRCDNPTASVRSQDKAFCICTEFEEIEKVLNQNVIKRQKLEKIYLQRKFNVYMWNYNRLEGQIKEKFLKRFIMDFSEYINQTYLSEGKFSEKIIADFGRKIFND